MADNKMQQMIIACPLCGAPTSAPCDHRKGMMVMTKARAAALAISDTFKDFPDHKSRAAGERDDN